MSLSIVISTLAVLIAVIALKKSLEPRTLQVRYLKATPVNQPLPPLPIDSPKLPEFLEVTHYVN